LALGFGFSGLAIPWPMPNSIKSVMDKMSGSLSLDAMKGSLVEAEGDEASTLGLIGIPSAER